MPFNYPKLYFELWVQQDHKTPWKKGNIHHVFNYIQKFILQMMTVSSLVMGQIFSGTKVFSNCMDDQEKLLVWEKNMDYQINSEQYRW